MRPKYYHATMADPIDIPLREPAVLVADAANNPIFGENAANEMGHSPINAFPEPRNNLWVPDSDVSKCTRCALSFGFWARKHHCRSCGNIFCGTCCANYIEIPEYISDITGDHARWNPSYWMPTIFGRGESGNAMLVCTSCETEINNIKLSYEPFVRALNEGKDIKSISAANSGYDVNVVDYYKHQLRLCQLVFPGEEPTQNQKSLLNNNARHFAGHSKYLAQLIKYCDWQNENEVNNVLQAISAKKNCDCSDLLCMSTCSSELKFDDIINVLSSYKISMDVTVVKHMFRILKSFSPQVIIACIVHLANLVVDHKQLHPFIFDVVNPARINSSTVSSEVLMYRMFWALEIMREEMTPEKSGNVKSFYSMFSIAQLRVLQKEFEFFKKLLDDIDKDSVNTEFTTPIHLPYDPSVLLMGIQEYDVKESENRPVVITFEATLNKRGDERIAKRIMFKRDNVTHDHNVSNLIHIIDMILSATINGSADDKSMELSRLPNYTVMPIAKNIGMIEYLDAETLSSVIKTAGIGQYLIDHNSGDNGLTVRQLKANYEYSLVGYTLIAWFLGVGDRHLKNILLTKYGELIHIDFAYMLGDQPASVTDKSLPLTCDMVGFIGGPNSPAFAKYVRNCVKGATVLKKYWNLFHLILCQDVNKDKVEQFIRKRFQIRQRNSVVNDEVRTYVQNLYGSSTINNMIIDSSTTLLKYATRAIRIAGVVGLL